LTAGHVTSEAGLDCALILADGRTIRGKTLGVNKEMDSGLIKITDEGPWPFVGMGKAESLKQGQWCIAMGHPNGYRRDRPPVVRLGRVLLNATNMVMTDCTLVGGDSGGPLFDLEGNVIGINSRIGTPTSANMHVPVDTFVETWERLADGEVWGLRNQPPRAGGPVLGIIGVDLPEGKGCRVERVDKNSPAEKAGVVAEDIITSFDGKMIVGLDPLVELISKKRAGDEVEVELLRDGKPMTVKVKLAPRP
jgi:serine protease Do